MTPLAKAQEILDGIEALAASRSELIPTLKYAQTGPQVVPCESLIAAALYMAPHEAYGPMNCNVSQLGTFAITLAWDCSWVANEDGSTDPTRVASASVKMDESAELLWEYAATLQEYLSKQWTISHALTGGLGIVTLSLTIGID